MLALLAAVACSDGDGVSQADYDAVKADLAKAQAELQAAQGETMSGDMVSKADYDALQKKLDDAMAMPSGGEMMGSRLDTVKQRGSVICASRNDVPGYGSLDASGNNVGFDIDLCRALATAVLGDPNAIEIRLITAAERGPTIQSGEVDMLVRTVTWTTSRDASWGNYAQTMFYDGQGFMVPADLGVTSAYELGGAAVCVTAGTTTELNMADFFRQNNLEYNPKVFEDTDVVLESYKSGSCDVFTNDRSQLAALRSALPNPGDHVILPETISEEPLGPVVPHGDEQWFDIVKTVISGLIYAEAYGITSANYAQVAAGDNVKAKRLLGTEGSFGQETLGLSETFMQDVLRSVGNYGEIYDRNLGPGGIDLPREGGRNALWANAPCTDCPKGGQIYAPPLR
jgi:general L-amino acid transport system substrate-binding protein